MGGPLALLWLGLARAADLPLVLNFDESDGGLEVSGDPAQWEWGLPSAGPDPGGARVWATRLDRDYMHEADDLLRFPPADLHGVDRPVLGLSHWYEIAPGDVGVVELLLDGEWTAVEPVYGSPDPAGWTGESGGWRTDWVDLRGVQDLHDVRLRFRSDAAGAEAGWVLGAAQVAAGDPVPPQITLGAVPSDTTELVGPYIVTATILDDVGLSAAELVWVREGEGAARVALAELSPGFWSGGIPGAAPGTSTVWWIEADDGTNRASSSAQSFRVYLPAPTGLRGPEGRVVDTHATLTWTPPESVFSVERYRVWRGDSLVAESTAPIADAPLLGPVDLFTVSARFQTPSGLYEGDRSAVAQVAASVPEISALRPTLAWAGDAVHLSLTGRNLLLVDGAVQLDLGEGVEITEINVIDVDHLEAELSISAEAEAGPRTLWVETGGLRLAASTPVQIEPGERRPQITGLDPAELQPGEQATVRLRLSRALAGPAQRVDAGEGVVVGAVRAVGPSAAPFALDVELTALPDAVLGERQVTVDDGERLWTGGRLRVRPPDPPAARVCSASSTSSSWWVMLPAALLCAAGRRRLRRS